MRRRTGRPSLLGTMARTAVIAGTASSVAGGVQQRQSAQQQAAADAQAAKQAQAAQVAQLQEQVNTLQQTGAPASAPSPAAAPPADDLMGQLQQLAAMHQSGILTEAEFSAAKARLLG